MRPTNFDMDVLRTLVVAKTFTEDISSPLIDMSAIADPF